MLNLLHNNKAEVREVMEYYERIRAIREDRDMKQSEVAALLGKGISPVATGDERLRLPTPQAFKKSLTKTFNG